MADDKPFFLRNPKQLQALGTWLKSRRYNTWTMGRHDKKGNPMVGLKYDDKPDSTFGGQLTNAGLVIVLVGELEPAVYEIVKHHAND